jgi:pre-mRNA-splicing helicase BRR2
VTTAAHRGPRGPSGLDEVKSLRGRMTARMGDLAYRSRPSELVERMHKRAKDAENTDVAAVAPVRAARANTSILAAATALQEQGLYRPRTKDTQAAYEQLLTFVSRKMEDQV